MSSIQEGPSGSDRKPKVMGLYGLPGSGKTSLLRQLKQTLKEGFIFFEGAEVVAEVVPGGLAAFKALKKEQKTRYRQQAITKIEADAEKHQQDAVVTGHFMFWEDFEKERDVAWTEGDSCVFTHILYLNVAPDELERRRVEDDQRVRLETTAAHLKKWQDFERVELRQLCLQKGILFMSLCKSSPDRVLELLLDFQLHNEQHNLLSACETLNLALGPQQEDVETLLMIDGDRTLTVEDTGKIFWQSSTFLPFGANWDALKILFDTHLGYSYTAFRQVTLLYEEVEENADFDTLCDAVASAMTFRNEFANLLRSTLQHKHTRAVVVTCGLRRIWEKILERADLFDKVKVVGGGRIADGFVVTAAVKAGLVQFARDQYQARVWAFGDSKVDLGMLIKADEAIVVVGEEGSRSKSMDGDLQAAIDKGYLQARQVLLPRTASPRLDAGKLPVTALDDPQLIEQLLVRRQRKQVTKPNTCLLTNTAAAQILMTPTRDARNSGYLLREAHQNVGSYLALQSVASIIGTEDHLVPHVQGGATNGYRLSHEETTTIVALMRGGEPLALGVSRVFPLAMFVHAKQPEDLEPHHVEGQHTVILVDSVINNGKTVDEFIQHIRKLAPKLRIAIIAGVVQAKALTEGRFADTLAGDETIHLVALRASENKYTGKGGTDTGARLFNTTNID